MNSIPTSGDIDAEAVRLGLADHHGRCLPKHRARVARSLQEDRRAPKNDVDVEDLHEVIIRLDNRLLDAKVHHTVRAAAVGALVKNLTSVEVEVHRAVNQ